MLAAKNTFNLHAFALEVDIGIHNKMGSSTPRGQVHIYLLRDNPMKTPQEYANGLDDIYDGVRVSVFEGARKNVDTSRGAPAKEHLITTNVRDENNQIIESFTSNQCWKALEDLSFVIASKRDDFVVGVVNPRTHEEDVCTRMKLPEDFFSEDHDTYIVIAAKAGEEREGTANEHIVHWIKFKDIMHLHDSEEINTPAEEKPMISSKPVDLIRKQALSDNVEHTVSSYNAQQMKHNQLYSELVAQFLTNSERIVSNLENLPEKEQAQNISQRAVDISSRYDLLQK